MEDFERYKREVQPSQHFERLACELPEADEWAYSSSWAEASSCERSERDIGSSPF